MTTSLGGTLTLHLLTRGRLGGRDVPAIAILRLIPVVRMGTTVGAGLIGIRLRDFVLGSAIAARIWTAMPLGLGFTFRGNFQALQGDYRDAIAALPFALGILGLLIIAVVLGTNAATRARLRDAFALTPLRSLTPASLAKLPQESPPGV